MKQSFDENINCLADQCNKWATEQFPNRDIKNVFTKLMEEVVELFESPDDPKEYADVFILLLDLAAEHGVDIAFEVNRKLEINKASEWTAHSNGIYKRIKIPAIENIGAPMREVTQPGDYK